MNPRLGLLKPYPFEKLRALLAGGARIDVPDTYLADSSNLDDHQWQVRFETEDGVQRDPALLEMWMLCVPDLSTEPVDP